MPIRVVCASCGKTIKAGDDWAGKRAKCPGCGADIDIPAAELQVTPPPPVVVEGRANVKPIPPPRLESGHVAHAPSVNVHLPKRSSSVGIVSLILGVLGIMFCWLPLIGILTIPLSGLGLLLGGIGLLVALARRGAGIGWPIAGVVVSGLALLISGSQVAVIGATASAMNEAATARIRTNQTTMPNYEGDDFEVTDDSEVVADGFPQNVSSPAPLIDTSNSESETQSESGWASAERPVRQGDVQVRVLRVAKEKVPLKDFDGQTTSKDELLSVYLETKNLGTSQKINYRGWQGGSVSFTRDYASLTDNFDNIYKRVTFGYTTKIVGQVDSESIYPGQSVNDLLVFEPPIETAEYLDLELPAENFGGEGMLRLRIPRKMLGGPDPEKLAAERATREAREREKREQQEQARKAEQARLAAIEEAKFRTWTAASGDHTTEAKIISYGNGIITLENRSGKQTKVPAEKLSDADREYIEQWRREKR